MASIFVSYSRSSLGVVTMLVSDLDALGHTVWFDQDLSGGHAWWNQILGRIRECDLFVFILDAESLDSTACQREYGYAAGLSKRILPVLVSGAVSTNLLPPALSQIQFVDYRVQDRDAVLRLAKALSNLPPPVPLPDPLPPTPPVPTSYLGNLSLQVDTESTLTYEQQSALLVDLRRHFRDPSTANDARALLERLRKRRDLFATIAEEMAELIATPARESTRVPKSQTGSYAPSISSVATVDVEPQLPTAAPETLARLVTPSRQERRRSAVIGFIVGAVVGALSVTTSPYFDTSGLLFGILTGSGGAIAGAITGPRLRLVAFAIASAVVGWIIVTAAEGSRDAFAVGGVLGTFLGAVLGALVGVLLQKRIPWLHSNS